jgi:hypothetical protein
VSVLAGARSFASSLFNGSKGSKWKTEMVSFLLTQKVFRVPRPETIDSTLLLLPERMGGCHLDSATKLPKLVIASHRLAKCSTFSECLRNIFLSLSASRK